MRNRLISGIVPVFSGERYLGETLDSMLAQTHSLLEIIVVDDGSTDGTRQVVAKYGDKVRYLRQENSGPAVARNRGLDAAHGEYIAFLDADDLWHPEKLGRQIVRFKERPETDCCVTHVQNFCVPELGKEEEKFRNYHLSDALPGYIIQTLLARRTLFKQVGKFNDELNYCEDTEWFLRTSESGAVFELLPDVLVYRRLHNNNMSIDPHTLGLPSSAQDILLRVLKESLDRRRIKDEGPARHIRLPGSDWRKEKG